MIFNLNAFKGCVPRANPRMIPDTVGQVAANCKTDSGTMRPFQATVIKNTPSKAGTKKSIYLYRDVFWLHWITDVDVVRGPIAGNTQDRMYWTGDGAPKVSDASIITAGGGTNYPTTSYLLGVPAPSTCLVAIPQGAAGDPTQLESRAYVMTFVSVWGEESPPCPVSLIIKVGPAQEVLLSSLALLPSGAFNIVGRRIYRTATGPTGTDYRFVATLAAAAVSYTDKVATGSLGEAIPSTTWDMPPDNMHSLKLHPSGFMVGISGKDICFSELYMPHAWPEGYRVPINHTPIGLGIFGNTVLVMTDSHPYAITGTDPASMMVEKLEINQACVSKRGIVDIGEAVAYPSPDGLIVIGPGVAKNVTENIYRRDQWQAMGPSSIVSAFHDGKYYGFFPTYGIVLDFSGEDVKTIDIAVTAAYADPITDTLYLQVGANIVAWDSSPIATFAEMRWRSKIFVAPHPIAGPGVAHVRAKAYPVTLNLYADGLLKHSQTVTSSNPFRLPAGYHFEEYEIEIRSFNEIYSAVVASTMAELKGANHI